MRSRKIGKKLMIDAEIWAKKKGFSLLYLEASDTIGFYQKLGYEIYEGKVYPQFENGIKIQGLYK